MSRKIFDAYLIIDWSANSTPKKGRDSIWYCLIQQCAGKSQVRCLENPPTRWQARLEILDILKKLVSKGLRVLVGFDFPIGYPAGFARAACFSEPTWRGVWDGLDMLVQDNKNNNNNRFEVATALNHKISGGSFPFWGCPPHFKNPLLLPRKTRAYHSGMPEYRLCESLLPRAQPCWKLYTTGSVGSQSLVGIPILKSLRDAKSLQGRILVWPFETGLLAAKTSGAWQVILTEVYPSILRINKKQGTIFDAIQVEAIGQYLASRDKNGRLAKDFAGPNYLDAVKRGQIIEEEGWILGAGTFD